MDNLEKFITSNRALFDDREPSAGHFARFEERLQKEEYRTHRGMNRNIFLKVAAIALILITAGLITFDLTTRSLAKSTDVELASIVLPADIMDAYEFYEQRSQDRMNEITRLTADCPKGTLLREKAINQVNTFNGNSAELRKALSENPENERIQAALIQNQKLKESALNNILLEGNMDNCRKK